MKLKYYSRKLANKCIHCLKPYSNGFVLLKDGSEDPCHALCAKKANSRIRVRKNVIDKHLSQFDTSQAKISEFHTGNSQQIPTQMKGGRP